MKKIITKYAAWLVIAVMIILLIPAVAERVETENKNNNIVVSLSYKDLGSHLSPSKLSETMDELRKAGVNVVSVSEEDLSTLSNRGELTSLTYGVLCHKYDEESMYIAEQIEKTCSGQVASGSHIIIAKKAEAREKLSQVFPLKYTEAEYAKVEGIEVADVYVIFDERKPLWSYNVGYDEDDIKMLSDKGFEIALVYKVSNYPVTDYLSNVEEIVKKYNVEYINLKEDTSKSASETENAENYEKLARIINDNNMTLVVTENTDQLSNQNFMGYSYVFDAVMSEDGSKKVLRSYETYDDSVPDETNYEYRTTQNVNSTIDRNIRFVTVTLAIPGELPYDDCADNTVKATKLYIDNMKSKGFTVNEDPTAMDYPVNKPFNSAVCAVIMLMWLLLMYEMISGKKCFKLTLAALAVAAIAFGVTFAIPQSLLGLYPTAYSVLQSCFVMTLLLCFVKTKKESISPICLYAGALALVLVTLLAGSLGMGAMLSGVDYYMNNSIFRGIKLSLIVPALYTAIVFYVMYMKKNSVAEDLKKVLLADIKVYWVILVGIVGAVGIYYIVRSGNVNEISSAERLMRNTLAELFTARPRTKEFLIGYPSLMLFVYYAKNTQSHLLKGIFALGTAILVSSITNSFCHVFTDFSTIVERVINGLLVGVAVCVFVYIGNAIIVKIAKRVRDRF